MSENQPNPKPEPLFKLAGDGPVRAAVWLNTNQTTGEDYLSVSLYRTYRDKQGQWKTSTSFRPQDLASVSDLAIKADNLIQQKLTAMNCPEDRPEADPEPECEPDMGV